LVGVVLLSGCWTFHESDYPQTCAIKVPDGKSVSVKVSGFSAILTDYYTVSTYQTVYVPGYCGYHHYYPGHFATVPSTVSVPQARMTDIFIRRARDAFEQGGYVLEAAVPDWTVDVEFQGLSIEDGDQAKAILWKLCTLFFCDYSTVTWYAKLRIHDNRTGKLVLSHDYEQRYETKVFGLIPLFGISACDKTSPSRMQCWCLAALTDRAVADATAFLAAAK